MVQRDPSRFVVLEHHTPDGVHWDLMLQVETALWTWRMDRPPAEIGTTPLPLEKIVDHPLRFLTYEGTVQHNTGTVRICDTGDLELLENTPEAMTVRLSGQTLKGRFRLTRQQRPQDWMLTI